MVEEVVVQSELQWEVVVQSELQWEVVVVFVHEIM
ncbi:hypothetical protein Tco_0645108, partial [Tanacetum coccineum]